MGWGDLAMDTFNKTEIKYTVTSPSFEDVPILTELRAKEWIEFLSMSYGSIINVTLQEFRESFYEKNGKLEMRRTYQTNKPPSV